MLVFDASSGSIWLSFAAQRRAPQPMKRSSAQASAKLRRESGKRSICIRRTIKYPTKDACPAFKRSICSTNCIWPFTVRGSKQTSRSLLTKHRRKENRFAAIGLCLDNTPFLPMCTTSSALGCGMAMAKVSNVFQHTQHYAALRHHIQGEKRRTWAHIDKKKSTNVISGKLLRAWRSAGPTSDHTFHIFPHSHLRRRLQPANVYRKKLDKTGKKRKFHYSSNQHKNPQNGMAWDGPVVGREIMRHCEIM